MDLVVLHLEGVLVPEIWVEFAHAAGIPELERTTRDEPDYDKLMQYRLHILAQHHMGMKEIQDTIATMDPMEGAREFLDALRPLTQVIIISDTFSEFAEPPTQAGVGPPSSATSSWLPTTAPSPAGRCAGPRRRSRWWSICRPSASRLSPAATATTTWAITRASKAGFLFKTNVSLKADNPDVPALETYDQLLDAIKENLD